MADRVQLQVMIDHINAQCDENFRFTVHHENHEWFVLHNGDVLITEDWDYEVEQRVRQIVKENGVQIDWPEPNEPGCHDDYARFNGSE
jgi:hypothetical protein